MFDDMNVVWHNCAASIKHVCATRDTYAGQVNTDSAVLLATRVRDLMTARGWSQAETARRSGVSRRGVGYVINHRDDKDRYPTLETVDALARAFGLDAAALLHRDTLGATGVAEAQPLDSALLATSIRECIAVFHQLGRLPSFDELAATAVHMYTNVQTGIPLRRAAAQVSRDLDQIRRGTKLASLQESFGEDSAHGQGHPRTRRRGKARTD